MVLGAPAQSGVEVVLRDGCRVLVRPIAREDEGPILEFLSSLSLHSRYLRFFSLSPDLARTAHSSAAGGRDRHGVVACPAGCGEVVGHAGYWTLVPGRAEMAVAVADRYQGRGLGRVLLGAIADAAEKHGLSVLEMIVLPDNFAMLNLLGRSGRRFSARLCSGVITCELHLDAPEVS